MRAVFMAKCKRSAARALDWLVGRGLRRRRSARLGARPLDPRRSSASTWSRQRHGLPLVTRGGALRRPARGVDVVISFLYWKLIREPLISLGRIGCLNFHPAPLPDLRGLGGYNVAILEGRDEWGVSCHFVDERFDTGDLVERRALPDRLRRDATAFSLDLESQERLLALFQRVMARALRGEELPRTPQGEGRYVTREEFEELRRVRPGDDVERKLRAFWYPPHPGAVIELDGRLLTLVDERLLAETADAYRAAGLVP